MPSANLGCTASTQCIRRTIYGFMHVATINDWGQVLDDHLALVRSSGLLDRTERVYVTILGPAARSLRFSDPKFEVVYRAAHIEEGEGPILRVLHEFCQTQACLVHYTHTKGVFSGRNNPCVADWRRYMQYFIVERHMERAKDLEAHDLSGVNWRVWPWPHFSGNFWWARSDHVRTLVRVDDPAFVSKAMAIFPAGESPRYAAEAWIGSNPRSRVACAHESEINHYAAPYPRAKYA